MPNKCLVPSCQSHRKENVGQKKNKIKFWLPKQIERRNSWFAAVGIENIPKGKSYWCCEDHFNLSEDTKNWLEYNTIENVTLRLKDDVVPHKNLYKHSKENLQEEPPSKLQKFSPTMEQQKENSPEYLPSTSMALQPTKEEQKRKSPKYLPSISMALQKKDIEISPMSIPSASSDVSESIDMWIESSSTDEELQSAKAKALSEVRQKTTCEIIEKNSRFYLGLPKNVYMLVQFITHWENINYRDVLITFKKIRLNDAYFRLHVDFGVSLPTVQRGFVNGVKKIANIMQNFIFTHRKEHILSSLPLPFRFRYSNVTCIIDCFEIEIEKPENPVKQSFTWSEYKKCNTAKYLLSATPHGYINFVSQGFGGRISDNSIVSASGFLNTIKDSAIMADRGFKNIAPLLSEKNCKLIRPPSVIGEHALSKAQVKEAKRIASLRIHIERAIARIREFDLLKPHEKINSHLVGLLDEIVIIACGLINLQEPLIK